MKTHISQKPSYYGLQVQVQKTIVKIADTEVKIILTGWMKNIPLITSGNQCLSRNDTIVSLYFWIISYGIILSAISVKRSYTTPCPNKFQQDGAPTNYYGT